MSTQSLIEAFGRWIVPNYARFPLAFVRGRGAWLWDAEGREYLDFGSGIAVNILGHSHPAIADAIARQARTLVHTSNLYHTESQALLAQRLVGLVGPGKCFFCNSGAEANETLFKLARKFGHDTGRYEILTALDSFHGRTLAGIAATGQEKVKKGFEPAVEGFRHIPFNDLDAARGAVTSRTAAILIEGVQGESGIHPASAEYLFGLRTLCDERNLLLLMDSVQCGMFRTGCFQSYQRILETRDASPHPSAFSLQLPGSAALPQRQAPSAFLPDAVSMAKGIAGGVPMGAIWARQPCADILGAGTHGCTFGGAPLACAAALAVFDVIEKEKLADHARRLGEDLKSQISNLKSPCVREVRGLGLMIGIELKPEIASLRAEGKTPASLFVGRLHAEGLLTIPAGSQTIRILPPLNVAPSECDLAVEKLQKALAAL